MQNKENHQLFPRKIDLLFLKSNNGNHKKILQNSYSSYKKVQP